MTPLGRLVGAGQTVDLRAAARGAAGPCVGQTAGGDVLRFHGVTLGGLDDRSGRRHAMVGDRVLVGAGAKLVGPISVGSDAKIGANAVVLSDVPEGATAVGILGGAATRATREERCCHAA